MITQLFTPRERKISVVTTDSCWTFVTHVVAVFTSQMMMLGLGFVGKIGFEYLATEVFEFLVLLYAVFSKTSSMSSLSQQIGSVKLKDDFSQPPFDVTQYTAAGSSTKHRYK